ncbi:serine protease [Bradyrhizobium sp. AUGA SZCCT0160]|uniref:trypsin-like serine peptidase n=1 Tax=Bradyrhizobium sp. AUGA SZCCT0160 TaxID=2807662 RepID=UPI001BACCEBE|nr:serine protease [Bradyrhizobium sp. AUGA SZCCT0160]MBR1188555.1 trypsin-like peptidase domain-containing protein [Bradyrhizobium sp. AUGA SZCCT0160]
MGWKQERIEKLASVIATHVPLDLLREVVGQYGIVKDFDERLKAGPQDTLQRAYELALAIVLAHDKLGLAGRFARTIYYKIWQDPAAGRALNEFATDDDTAKQASHVKRAATLSDQALARFLEETRPRICMICAYVKFDDHQEHFSRGTGFLVGPDLVLTARHVLRHHIRDGAEFHHNTARLGAFFDHFDGDPIDDFNVQRNPPFFVGFANKWLEESSDEMDCDGLFRNPTEEQLGQLCRRLDVALIRLAERVGDYTRSPKGGVRRLWFDIPDDAVPARLQFDDRVIIRQHPHGHPLRIDFGRYRESDQSFTRIRYTTETDPGSSGAPCFNQHYELIGMHNAEYRPDGELSVLNQAIRFDHIANKIRPKLTGFVRPGSVRIWNASTSIEAPIPILGRAKLLDWIVQASEPLPASRFARQYAAVARLKGSGRTFSTDILRAARRGPLDRIVVLGTSTEALPLSAIDFIAAIADQLRIPPSDLAQLPPRPSIDLPDGNWDGDKLYRWACEAVPVEFAKILRSLRAYQVDRVEEAKEIVQMLEGSGRTPSQEDLALAARADKLMETRHRWDRIWIVVDGLNEGEESDPIPLSEEVRNLIAGLLGGKLDEANVPEELRRLRWLFLGRLPYTVPEEQICIETLNPDRIGLDELLECIAALANTFNKPLLDETKVPLRASLRRIMLEEAIKTKLGRPAERLQTLQQQFAMLAPMLAEEYRGDHERL